MTQANAQQQQTPEQDLQQVKGQLQKANGMIESLKKQVAQYAHTCADQAADLVQYQTVTQSLAQENNDLKKKLEDEITKQEGKKDGKQKDKA